LIIGRFVSVFREKTRISILVYEEYHGLENKCPKANRGQEMILRTLEEEEAEDNIAMQFIERQEESKQAKKARTKTAKKQAPNSLGFRKRKKA